MLYFDIEEKLIPEKINELSKIYNSSAENMRYKIIYIVLNIIAGIDNSIYILKISSCILLYNIK